MTTDNPAILQYNYCPHCGASGYIKHNQTHYECKSCGKHLWNNAKAATALALVKDGQLLVVKRAREPNKGKYELPGGFIDFGEPAYESAIREAQEELGVVIAKQDMKILDVYYNDYNPGIFTVDIIFLVERWQGKLAAADDVDSFSWQSLDFIYADDFCQKYDGLDKLISARLQI